MPPTACGQSREAAVVPASASLLRQPLQQVPLFALRAAARVDDHDRQRERVPFLRVTLDGFPLAERTTYAQLTRAPT